ncbi:zinc ribbon domain-containing protein [Desulfitobacterium metallireducens]|uniref:Zinc-ribbon domain-containing protein n=1 Tax=Desulfitobacterium metallireducens DSM 15288 TaxID=871968 RepID=W0EH52_9FIRM|nr:zinc ribbon domain-containing protein [Desulfitobacterium metallireducens]AHF08396.1 hypothetical protein DESME_01820 [Desulfitobacterium metallireducens DSM 15288]
MRWSERIKLAFETFKRVALPIYGWYFIFAFAGLGILITGLLPFLLPMLNRGTRSFSGPFPNPNPPMPPGVSSGGLSPFGDMLAPYLSSPYLAQAPYFLLFFLFILLLSWLGSSAFMTGMFNLTQKAFHEAVRFRDFRFSGIPRVLGWYGILTLVSFLVILAGIFGAFALRGMSYALPLFGGLYVLLMVSLALFLMPWFSTSAFYMLNHRDLNFTHSLKGSWNFYQRNMGSLWIYFITMIGIQILISFINQASTSLGFIVALLAGPFTAILPIVWVLSLEEEENQQRLTLASPSDSESTLTLPQESTSDASASSPSAPVSPSASEAPMTPASPANQESEIPPAAQVLSDSVNYCPTCGQKTRPGANYCAQCGTQL